MILLKARVIPRSSRTVFAGIDERGLRLKVKAPPVEGAANKECVSFLAKTFGVSKSSVSLLKGQTSKSKTFSIQGLTKEQAVNILSAIIDK